MKKLSNFSFLNAAKTGYLTKRSSSIFHQWSEKFSVLTNVGLLCYDDPSKKPKDLFPIISSTIYPVPKSKYKKDFVFVIVSFNVEIEFAAPTKEEYDSWMKEFKNLQDEFDRKKEKQLSFIPK